jgi:hypothetical protein
MSETGRTGGRQAKDQWQMKTEECVGRDSVTMNVYGDADPDDKAVPAAGEG